MPAVSAVHSTNYPGLVHADFVVGTRDDTTADAKVGALICDFLRARGYSVEYNFPYKGVELVRRYGDPSRHRHSVQIEINRRLYMDERTFELTPGYDKLKADLRALLETLLATDPRTLATSHAWKIRKGRAAWARPAGSFEAVHRPVGGGWGVWARYVGEATS